MPIGIYISQIKRRSVTMKWRTGKEIEKSINERTSQAHFQRQAKTYEWQERLSIWPRQCAWSRSWIRPFTYAMFGHQGPHTTITLKRQAGYVGSVEGVVDYGKWIAKPEFIVQRIKGKV